MSDSFVTPWTISCQAQTLLSMGFSWQEHWSGFLFHSPGNLPSLGTKPVSPALAGEYLPVNHLGSHIYLSIYMHVYVYTYIFSHLINIQQQNVYIKYENR